MRLPTPSAAPPVAAKQNRIFDTGADLWRKI
jgi:hypothetical protein